MAEVLCEVCANYTPVPAPSIWIETYYRSKNDFAVVGGAIKRDDIERYEIRHFTLGITNRWEVVAHTDTANHIVSTTRDTRASAQEALKGLLETDDD